MISARKVAASRDRLQGSAASRTAQPVPGCTMSVARRKRHDAPATLASACVEQPLQFLVELLGDLVDRAPRHALASAGDGGHDRRADDQAGLDGMDELRAFRHGPLGAADADRHDRHPGARRRRRPRLRRAVARWGPDWRVPSGKITSGSPCLITSMQRRSASRSALPRWTGNAPSALKTLPSQLDLPERVLAHVPHTALREDCGQGEVDVRSMDRRQDERAGCRDVLAPGDHRPQDHAAPAAAIRPRTNR